MNSKHFGNFAKYHLRKNKKGKLYVVAHVSLTKLFFITCPPKAFKKENLIPLFI